MELGTVAFSLVGLAAASVFLSWTCGAIWRSKGGEFRSAFFLSLIFPVLSLIYVAFAVPRTQVVLPGVPVTLRRSVKRLNGDRIPRGYRSTVLSTDVIDGQLAMEITAPDSSTLFVPAALAKPERSTTQSQAVAPRKKCPMCAEIVMLDARVCRYCGHAF